MAASAGYSSRFLAWAYAAASPLYDLIVWWGFLPLGGERRCRREFVRWIRLEPGVCALDSSRAEYASGIALLWYRDDGARDPG